MVIKMCIRRSLLRVAAVYAVLYIIIMLFLDGLMARFAIGLRRCILAIRRTVGDAEGVVRGRRTRSAVKKRLRERGKRDGVRRVGLVENYYTVYMIPRIRDIICYTRSTTYYCIIIIHVPSAV